MGCVILEDMVCECHKYSSRYGYYHSGYQALNAMHTQADMVIIIEDMAINAMHTQPDMVVLFLKIWL